jgi:hypothetical protein
MKKYEKQSWRKEEVAIVKRVLTENAGVQIGFVSLAEKVIKELSGISDVPRTPASVLKKMHFVKMLMAEAGLSTIEFAPRVQFSKEEDRIICKHLIGQSVNIGIAFEHALEEIIKLPNSEHRNYAAIAARWYKLRNKSDTGFIHGVTTINGTNHNAKNIHRNKETGELPEFKRYPLIEMVTMFMALTNEERNAVLLIIKPKS